MLYWILEFKKMCFEFLRISETQSARNAKGKSSVSKMRAVKGLFTSAKARFKSGGTRMGITSIKTKICEMSGWKPGTDKYIKTHDLFVTIWRKLSDIGDENMDGKITTDEWLRMWEKFNEQCIKETKKENEESPEKKVPDWLQAYIEYKFNLYDRTGDGKIDVDEFEYVLSDFGVPPKDARSAFLMFSQNNEKKVDLEYFKELCSDYYRSDDPGALGNFITGKLVFADE
ncbi:hypothetical protein KUTeg_015718 [Tegillarca granosa]|uniref:EF-hand domain-containing protein n=1 Tax=Tegillarca granosa TaxID=220873 RepID=A0ABQ9ERW6_TEGGR|nr:hypothetical protein KUTeg_015718 [Tegillarca granosa]